MPAIEEGYAENFKTMLQAAADGRLVLLDCQDRLTGRPVRVIVAIADTPGEPKVYTFVPFARMFDGDPYKELNPPSGSGGYVDAPFQERR